MGKIVIRDLFARTDWLGWAGIAFAGLAVLAVLALVIREIVYPLITGARGRAHAPPRQNRRPDAPP